MKRVILVLACVAVLLPVISGMSSAATVAKDVHLQLGYRTYTEPQTEAPGDQGLCDAIDKWRNSSGVFLHEFSSALREAMVQQHSSLEGHVEKMKGPYEVLAQDTHMLLEGFRSPVLQAPRALKEFNTLIHACPSSTIESLKLSEMCKRYQMLVRNFQSADLTLSKYQDNMRGL